MSREPGRRDDPLLVLKLGGSSLATPETLRAVAARDRIPEMERIPK